MPRVRLLPGDAVMSAALGAALAVHGRQPVLLGDETEPADCAQQICAECRLVLVADAHGRLPDPRAALAGRRRPFVAAVSEGRAFAAPADVVEREVTAAVLDADQPFADLVTSPERLLRLPASAHDTARLVSALTIENLQARDDRFRQYLAGLGHDLNQKSDDAAQAMQHDIAAFYFDNQYDDAKVFVSGRNADFPHEKEFTTENLKSVIDAIGAVCSGAPIPGGRARTRRRCRPQRRRWARRWVRRPTSNSISQARSSTC